VRGFSFVHWSFLGSLAEEQRPFLDSSFGVVFHGEAVTKQKYPDTIIRKHALDPVFVAQGRGDRAGHFQGSVFAANLLLADGPWSVRPAGIYLRALQHVWRRR